MEGRGGCESRRDKAVELGNIEIEGLAQCKAVESKRMEFLEGELFYCCFDINELIDF